MNLRFSDANYPPGVSVMDFREIPPPVSDCGDCRAVKYDRDLVECGCGCGVRVCDLCTTTVDGRAWRTGCARDHRDELAVVARQCGKEYTDLVHDLREALKILKRITDQDGVSSATIDAARRIDEAADLLEVRAREIRRAA